MGRESEPRGIARHHATGKRPRSHGKANAGRTKPPCGNLERRRRKRNHSSCVPKASASRKSTKREAVKEAEILRAEGASRAKVLQAEAEAEAIRRVAEAIQSTKTDPASYMLAVKYIETLNKMVSGKDNKTVYIPYEATGILGSIGSIKDIFCQISVPTGTTKKKDAARHFASRILFHIAAEYHSPKSAHPPSSPGHPLSDSPEVRTCCLKSGVVAVPS